MSSIVEALNSSTTYGTINGTNSLVSEQTVTDLKFSSPAAAALKSTTESDLTNVELGSESSSDVLLPASDPCCGTRISAMLIKNPLYLHYWILVCAAVAPFMERLVAFSEIGTTSGLHSGSEAGFILLLAANASGFVGWALPWYGPW